MAKYVVRARHETDDEKQPLYWNNVDGWVSRDSATLFTVEEMERFTLPRGGLWVGA